MHRSIIRVLHIVLLLAAPGLTLLSNSADQPVDDLSRIERQVHQYVNQERLSNGLHELKWSNQISMEARRHATNIAAGNFFAHEDPLRGDVDLRLNKSGIDWQRCAENLYEGNFGDPAKAAVKAWLHSPGHRKNMMDSMFNEAGVGVAQRQDGVIIIVQEYILQ
jgi:uncharacterized protein YkwD